MLGGRDQITGMINDPDEIIHIPVSPGWHIEASRWLIDNTPPDLLAEFIEGRRQALIFRREQPVPLSLTES